jgi:hypothetical protein
MNILFLHFRTLVMNACPDGSLRWQLFTGVAIGSRYIGRMKTCQIDNEAALAEDDRTWNAKAPEKVAIERKQAEILELEMTGVI